MKIKAVAMAITSVLALSSCALTQTVENNKETVIGCAVGTGIGALIGNYLGGKNGIAYGAAAGAAIGCSIGYDAQKKREALDALAKSENLDIKFASISTSPKSQTGILINSSDNVLSASDAAEYSNFKQIGMAATISSQDDTMFASGSSIATNKAKKQFEKLAYIYKNSTANILITGHTDSSGSEELNQKLSEDRAKYVAQIFSQAGIPIERLFFQGAGEAQPVAANSLKEGQAQNRRVEVIEIEGSAEQLLAYSYKQKTNLSYLSRRSQDRVTGVKSNEKSSVATIKPKETTLDTALTDISLSDVSTLMQPVTLKLAKVDFGGNKMVDVKTNFSELVGVRKEDSFALFSKAYASEVSSLNCVVEGPRVDGDIKSLATGQSYNRSKYNTADYLPGMNGTVWAEKVNGHYIGLTPIAVIKDSGKAVSSPEVKIWKDYQGSNSSQSPNYQLATHIETYYGESGLLYRIFSQEQDAPLRCMDIVMPIDKTAKAIAGKLYYEKNKAVYEVSFEPKLLQ
jgi:outer membrane protein OmpA-like peptidoglycan-associated protein